MTDKSYLSIPLAVANDVAIAGKGGTVEALRLLLVAESSCREGVSTVTVPLSEVRRLTGATMEAVRTAVGNLAHLRASSGDGEWFCPVVGVLRADDVDEAEYADDVISSVEEEENDYVISSDEDDDDDEGPRFVTEAVTPVSRRTFFACRHRAVADGKEARKMTPASVTVAFHDRWLALSREQTVSIPSSELAALRTRAAVVLRLRLAGMLHANPAGHRDTIDTSMLGFYTGTDQAIGAAAMMRSYWDPALAEIRARCPSVVVEATERTRRGRLDRIDLDVATERLGGLRRPRRVRVATKPAPEA